MRAAVECRICLKGSEDGVTSPLLSDVCACRGTQRYVHADCLAEWQARCIAKGYWRQLWFCTTCGSRFTVRAYQRFPLDVSWQSYLSSFAIASPFFGLFLAWFLNIWSERIPDWVNILEHSYDFQKHERGSPSGAWWGKFYDDKHKGPPHPTGASLVFWNNTVLCYGGWDDSSGPRNSLWVASWPVVRKSQKLIWSRLSIAGLSLPPTYGQTVTSIGHGRFFIFGGNMAGGYRLPSPRWAILSVSNGQAHILPFRHGQHAPLALAWHSATWIASRFQARRSGGYVFVFGGSTDFGPSRAVLVFNLRHGRWALNPKWITGTAPPARTGHSAVLMGGRSMLWIIGGTDGHPMPWRGRDLFDGIWRLDVVRFRWRRRLVIAPGLPTGRQHTAVLARGHLFCFGGGLDRTDMLTSIRLSDLSIHNLTPSPLRGRMNISITGRAEQEIMNVSLESVPPPSLRGHAALWTGSDMIVYGGSTAGMGHTGYSGMLVVKLLP